MFEQGASSKPVIGLGGVLKNTRKLFRQLNCIDSVVTNNIVVL